MMTEKEFRAIAAEYGYSGAEIDEFVDLINQARKDGAPMKFEDIELIEQPEY